MIDQRRCFLQRAFWIRWHNERLITKREASAFFLRNNNACRCLLQHQFQISFAALWFPEINLSIRTNCSYVWRTFLTGKYERRGVRRETIAVAIFPLQKCAPFISYPLEPKQKCAMGVGPHVSNPRQYWTFVVRVPTSLIRRLTPCKLPQLLFTLFFVGCPQPVPVERKVVAGRLSTRWQSLQVIRRLLQFSFLLASRILPASTCSIPSTQSRSV
jgi:hypothetical protein